MSLREKKGKKNETAGGGLSDADDVGDYCCGGGLLEMRFFFLLFPISCPLLLFFTTVAAPIASTTEQFRLSYSAMGWVAGGWVEGPFGSIDVRCLGSHAGFPFYYGLNLSPMPLR